jgi:hypothetical protein
MGTIRQMADLSNKHPISTTLPVPADDAGLRPVAPTDIAQFIRLDQCERYLRLRLHERAAGQRFMRVYDVVPQSIPPLLTRSGERFETRMESAIAERYPSARFIEDERGIEGHDNERLLRLVMDLAPGDVLVLFQPRLQATVGHWRIRGDLDVVRLERSAEGDLTVLVADMKSSTAGRLEHRLQVAFYIEMLDALFQQAGIECSGMELGVLYRGSALGDQGLSSEEIDERAARREAAERYFGTSDALLDLSDPENYRDAVHDLVTGPDSTACRVAEAPFESVPFHLTYKCDGCLYNEFCMKWSAERDDLSLLPHVTSQDKGALRRAGVTRVRDLAKLKEFRPDGAARNGDSGDLVPAPGSEDQVRQLSATWPVGPRLDELVHRARRYRKWKREPLKALSYIPSKGYGSLPYCDETQNPNLVTVFVDAQHDYLHDRIYMIGARVLAHAAGVPARWRSVVHLAEGPPEDAATEGALLVRWIDETIETIVDLAAPAADGQPRAPIHLVFYNHFDQRLLLDALARHFHSILGATPLYDFLTQMAAFDSPIATFLNQEIRELKNYPMTCQSLQAVAAYLGFDWNRPRPYRDVFRVRVFDFWGKFDQTDHLLPDESRWYLSRARFNSQIPLEYAYAAWDDLPEPPKGRRDEFAPYRRATRDLLLGFQARRLEALEWVTRDFKGNKQTQKSSFDLPDLGAFSERAATLANALEEFVAIERYVELAAWKSARLAPPERRVLSGDTLIVNYRESDQDPHVASENRENLSKYHLHEQYEREYFEVNPGASSAQLTSDQKSATKWSQDGLTVRLRLATVGIDCDLDEVLALTDLRPGDSIIVAPRLDTDSRQPEHEQVPYTPTPKQMLYQARGTIERLSVERDDAGRATSALVEVTLRSSYGGWRMKGFAFGSFLQRPFADGDLYTLDEDPNSWYGYWGMKVAEGLVAGGANELYARLVDPAAASVDWSPAAAEGQQRFLDGLDALHAAGALHGFEPSKREYIGGHGATPALLVQGPPGTGKSYTTAFAVFARLQGAMAANRGFRALLSCKTHAATDVLLENTRKVQNLLRDIRASHRDVFDAHIDRRLLDVPIYRVRPRGAVPEDVTPLLEYDSETDERQAWETIAAQRWCIVATTPGGVYQLVNKRWGSSKLFTNKLFRCLVLDETSQMNLPEAIMAALPLERTGQLVVVGDHRQMPPIVHHTWQNEPRRTFKEFRTYQSLFLALLEHEPPMIQFAESFRLHADMAEFLRREVYAQDGIRFFSRRRELLDETDVSDDFVASVLAADHPIVVIVHDEAESQVRNPFEQHLITPILEALADAELFALGPEDGLGVVVPHRAQRASLRDAVPALSVIDPDTGAVRLSSVDTVERFQGGERRVILVSATESDRDYLLNTGEFLLDPRRLTVALSRAKQKMVLVASRSVFNLFSADEEIFLNALLWKHLLRRTCTVPLWSGERLGHRVEVWGNASDHQRPGEPPGS